MALFKAGLVQLPLDRYEEAASWAKTNEAKSLGRRVSFYPRTVRGPSPTTLDFVESLNQDKETTQDTVWQLGGGASRSDAEGSQTAGTESTLRFYEQLQEAFVGCEAHKPGHTGALRRQVLRKRVAKPSNRSSASSALHETVDPSSSSSNCSSWGGGLRSRASGSCDSSSASSASSIDIPRLSGKGGKVKRGELIFPWQGKGNGFHSGTESPSDDLQSVGDLDASRTIITTIEFPESFLDRLKLAYSTRAWNDKIAEAAGAQIDVDQSRRAGHARVQIVGAWRESLIAYQLLDRKSVV